MYLFWLCWVLVAARVLIASGLLNQQSGVKQHFKTNEKENVSMHPT